MSTRFGRAGHQVNAWFSLAFHPGRILKKRFIFFYDYYTVCAYSAFCAEVSVKDYLEVAVQVQRIEILARTLVNDLYSEEDREMTQIWLAELATSAANEVKSKINEAKRPTEGH